ncbi:MAG TPA: CDP-alcohol phosphatidyltransferase family protein [Candidatus Paceibacterota bacterium]|nr:CDP-alcohol phosphatidyltransferase family protein [Candidatus Paceibacterota bacterium]
MHNRIMTRANAWTVSGILCVVAYTFSYLTDTYTKSIPLLVMYVIATDLVDGQSAAKWDAHTRLGAFLDPFRDRLLIAALLFNILLFPDANRLFLLLSTTAILATEMAIAIGNSIQLVAVHLIGKLRFGIHGLCTMQYVCQTYYASWPLSVPVDFLILGILGMSLVALIAYAIVWQTERV